MRGIFAKQLPRTENKRRFDVLYAFVPGDNLKARHPEDFHIAPVASISNEHLLSTELKTLCGRKIDFALIVDKGLEPIKIEELVPIKHKEGHTVCATCLEAICGKINFRITRKKD